MSNVMVTNSHALPEFPRGSWRISPWWVRDEKQAVRHSLIGVIEVSHRLALNPVPLIHALADEHRGWYRQRLLLLALRMNDGTNLVQALEQTPGLLTKQQLLDIRVGLQSGILSEVLERHYRYRDLASQDTWTSAYRAIIYFLLLLLFGGFIIGFLLIYIVPTFKELTEEFSGMDRESNSFQSVELLETWGPVVIPNLFIAAVLIWIASSYFGLGGFIESRALFGRLRSVSRMHGAGVLALLGQVLRQGRPVEGAVSSLARYHFSPPTRAKLLQVSNEVHHGESVWTGMRSAKIISAKEAVAFESAKSASQQAWIAEQLAEKRSREVATRKRVYVYLIYPALVLLAGAVVLSFALMSFGFLRDLIEVLI